MRAYEANFRNRLGADQRGANVYAAYTLKFPNERKKPA